MQLTLDNKELSNKKPLVSDEFENLLEEATKYKNIKLNEIDKINKQFIITKSICKTLNNPVIGMVSVVVDGITYTIGEGIYVANGQAAMQCTMPMAVACEINKMLLNICKAMVSDAREELKDCNLIL